VQKGQDTIQKNLTSLKQVFEILVEKIHELPQTERLLTPSNVPEATGSSWPSDHQRDALLADDEIPKPEASGSTSVSGNGQPESSLDDETSEEADPIWVPRNPQAVVLPADDDMPEEAAPESTSS